LDSQLGIDKNMTKNLLLIKWIGKKKKKKKNLKRDKLPDQPPRQIFRIQTLIHMFDGSRHIQNNFFHYQH